MGLPFIKLQTISSLPEGTSPFYGFFPYDDGSGSLLKLSTEKFFQIIGNVAVPISPSDAAPATEGWYKPQITSEDNKTVDPNNWGTLYANAGNNRAKAGYDTLFYRTASGQWKKAESKIGNAPKKVFDSANDEDPSTMKAVADYIKNPESLGAVKVGSGPGESVATLNFISNGYIDANGNLVASAPHKTTDFIPVPDGFSMLQVDEAATFAVAYYTASQTFIKTVGGNVPGGAEYNKVFDFTSNVKYVKYIHTVANIGVASLKFVSAVYSLPWLKSDTISKLAGKKIIWIGTSIPAGYPKQATPNTWAYPNIIANRNKATVSNKGVPNGVIRKALSNGGSMGTRDTLSFTNTASTINYQNAILDKIGTAEDPDIVVIDYGVNDYDADKSDIDNYATFDMTSENLNTFIGSMNFVIKKILQAKPSIKIYIITHFSNSSKSTGITSFANLNAAILKVGQYWQIPTLQLYNETGWIVKNGVDLIATMCPDSIHPASKTDTIAVNRLADIIEGFILTR